MTSFAYHRKTSRNSSFLLRGSRVFIHRARVSRLVPPVRRPESSTAVKAKTSAPLPLPATSRAALTRCAVCLPSPHREGTRSRRCGRRLTEHRGDCSRPAEKEMWGPLRRLQLTGPPYHPFRLCSSFASSGDSSVPQRMANGFGHRTRGGWRSGIPWACLYQLRTRSVASTPYQVCQHAPQIFFKSQAPKRSQGSAGSFPAGSDPTGLLHF